MKKDKRNGINQAEERAEMVLRMAENPREEGKPISLLG